MGRPAGFMRILIEAYGSRAQAKSPRTFFLHVPRSVLILGFPMDPSPYHFRESGAPGGPWTPGEPREYGSASAAEGRLAPSIGARWIRAMGLLGGTKTRGLPRFQEPAVAPMGGSRFRTYFFREGSAKMMQSPRLSRLIRALLQEAGIALRSPCRGRRFFAAMARFRGVRWMRLITRK